MDKELLARIQNNPSYKKLVTTRGKFAWTLSVIMFIVYYAFILFIAFSPETLSTNISKDSVITLGIPIGVFIIIFTFILTWYYVNKSNSEFDLLLNDIKNDLSEKK